MRAGQIDTVEGETHVVGYGDAVASAEKIWVRKEQLGGKAVLLEEVLRAVAIVEDQVEKGGSLGDCFFEEGPFVFGKNERHRVEGPKAFSTSGVAIDVVGDGVGADDLLGTLPATVELGTADRFEGVAKLLPVGSCLAFRGLVFVPEVGFGFVFPAGNFGFFFR